MPGSVGYFYIYLVVPQKNLAAYMQWTGTGDWSSHSIYFNIFTATVHAVECAMCLNLEWHIDISKWCLCLQETGWTDRHRKACVCNMQLTATLVNWVCTIKIHNNLDGQIYNCYFQHTAHKPPQITVWPIATKSRTQLLYSYSGTAAWQ